MKRTASLLLLLAAAPALAQQLQPSQESSYRRLIAAGYKAAMLCSGTFIAGRTQAQIESVELRGIYPEYQPLLPTLRAEIDRKENVVSVYWSDTLPPRQSQWTRSRGCTTLPVGRPLEPGPPDTQTPLPTFTGDDPRPWPVGDAGGLGRSSPALQARVATAFDGATYGKGAMTTGVVVLRDGRIVAEHYADGFGRHVANRTWSVAKSIAGTLIGTTPLAQNAIYGQADSPRLAAMIRTRPWQGGTSIDPLLRMASGLHGDAPGNRTDAVYFGGASVDSQVDALLLEAKPGTRFRYANNDILLAVASMRTNLGDDLYRTYPAAFFQKLGMAHTVAEQDWRGNYVLSSQVWSTARDLARLGQFWLQDGVWQGQRLLPEGWVRYMTTPSGPQPASGPGYGATLWLFGPAQGLPAGSYAAQGNRGQYVMVVPSERLVVVRRGEDGGDARFDPARFTADVIAALR